MMQPNTTYPAGPLRIRSADRTHVERRKSILAAHPEVKQLFGRNRATFLISAALLLLQTTIAATLGHLGPAYWPLAVFAALSIGAFANHANFAIIHDAIHNRIFESSVANKWTAILADLPNGVPTAMGFRRYHIRHHSHLSVHDLDAELPSDWEVAMVRNISWRKALWLFFFPVIQLSRLARIKGHAPLKERWNLVNVASILAFDLLVLQFLGVTALLYFLLSFWFSIGGLHPLSGRWIQEHFSFGPDQITSNYVGPLNKFALNVGYHNEHHDFPEVPWNKLPELKAVAPDHYGPLQAHRSWTKLILRFILDPKCSVASRQGAMI
jgi:sphingolipid 4-desaturase/C4-monooxygenase